MYISGFVLAVPEGNQEAYRKMAADAADMFHEFGATELVEAWEDNVPDGKVTDFRRAVNAEPGEKIVFSWIVWPDRKTCDEAHEKMVHDERMQAMPEMPFDGKRMIFGGFTPIFTSGR